MTDHARTPFNPDILGVLAAIAAALLFIPALQYGWVWDDAALSSSHATKDATGGFHPAVSLLYRMEWLIGVGSPDIYHFTSILLHAVATWLVFRLIRGVGATPGIAFVAALLFAAHPIHVEAVAYVTGRPDLLATVCALGALLIARSATICAPDGCRSPWLYAAYTLLAVAVLSDEVALVTPLLLIGLDRWGSPRVPTRGRTTAYVGFAAVAVAGILARIGAHQLRLNEPHELLAPGAGLWAPIIAAYEYLRALVVPYPLNAMRSLTVVEAASWSLRLAALASFAVLALIVWWRRHDPLARTGALLLALPLLPALPLPFSQGAYVEERAAYFASVGFCFLVGSLISWITPQRRAQTGAAILGILLAGVAAAGTMKRIPVWKSNVTLLADAARNDPKDPAPHLALADQYASVANYNAALNSVGRAIALDSTNADAYHKRTLLLNRLGRYPEAETAARRTVMLSPEESIYWANLGDLLAREGKNREALEATRKAVALDSTNAENWYNFGVSLGASDSVSQSIEAYRRAIAINHGHFQAINNLGTALASSGRMQEARDVYMKAVQAQPNSVQARMNLALASLRLGDTRTASLEYSTIQKMDPAAAQQLLDAIKMIEAMKGRPTQRAAPPPASR